jgi:flagellin
MSISVQTNVTSLIAQNNLRINTDFQSQTIQRLTSGYRINSSGDDAAGLAVANKYRSDTAELTQGVRNANDAIGTFQTIDSGLNNISQIADRLKTLATQSASSAFAGNRSTLDNEYQSLISEITRQASNINLNTGGKYNTNLVTYIGGGSNASNAQVSVDLSGANNAVDAAGLNLNTTSVAGGGSGLASNVVRLDDPAVSFLVGGSQAYNFHLADSTGNNLDVTATVAGGSGGLSGTQVISSLNNSLQAYGITAAIGSNGQVSFAGSTAFDVQVGAASAGNTTATSNSSTINTGNFNLNASLVAVTGTAEAFTVQNAGKSYNVSLSATTGATQASALTALNTQLAGSGISAIKGIASGDIQLQGSNSFSVVETALPGTSGGLFTALGSQTVTSASAAASNTGNALAALASLNAAVTNLGLIQGRVGAGENKLNYAVNLAQSQIANFSAAQSRIRDADTAAEAANLTKAQVLQQSSIAALAQANSAPQAILKLLQG